MLTLKSFPIWAENGLNNFKLLNYKAMLLFILAVIFIIAFIAFCFGGLIQQQKEDFKIYGKAGESYESFCGRFYTRWF